VSLVTCAFCGRQAERGFTKLYEDGTPFFHFHDEGFPEGWAWRRHDRETGAGKVVCDQEACREASVKWSGQ
jgi:hypothetical protein